MTTVFKCVESNSCCSIILRNHLHIDSFPAWSNSWLQNNLFTEGELPSFISGLTTLTDLYLGNTQRTGAIPAFLGNMTTLEGIDLSGNQLTGIIPESFTNLRRLQYLFLNDNGLTGQIPAFLGNMTELYELSFNNNQLNGKFPASVSSCIQLEHLNVSYNSLTGYFPESVVDLPGLIVGETLDYSHNLFLNCDANYYWSQSASGCVACPADSTSDGYEETCPMSHQNHKTRRESNLLMKPRSCFHQT